MTADQGLPAIVDSHVHLWEPARIPLAWGDKAPAINRPFLMADLDAQRGSVAIERIVFLECDVVEGRHLDEARWVAGLAEADSRIAGIVAHAPLHRGKDAERDLVELARIPLVKGVRRLIQDEPDPGFCARPEFIAGVKLLPAYGFSFDLCIYHHQLPAAIELVRRCPEVDFVLDHIAKPGIRAGLMEPWAAQLRALAGLPNVVCKISGVATEADHTSWTEAQLRPYIDHALACFGPDRVMFGGDWPVSTLAVAYPRWVEIVARAVAGWSPTDRRKLWRDNAIRVYRI